MKTITIIMLFLGIIPLSAELNIDSNTFYVDKDHPSASNTNVGSENMPWETIQHGVNQLSAGQRLYVKASQTPYFEPYRASGSNIGGMTINVSGTVTNPIIIEGYPNERPVIDQQRAMSYLRAEDGTPDDPNASKVLTGILFFNAHNIVLRNFEISQTSASGVMFASDRHNNNIVVENMHIHHLYGGDNTGGIRLDHADDAVVRNNIIHDIYDIRYPNGNPYTSEQFQLHAGVHGFQPGNCVIENNLIYNVSRGVYVKGADTDLKNANTVRRNIFYNISFSAYALEMQGSGSAPALNAKFYENIVYNAKGGVSSALQATSGQSNGILIYNNTFYDVNSVATLRGQTGIEFYNNIISDSTIINFSTAVVNEPNITNAITYLDNNLYYNHANKWILNRYASNFMEWTNFQSWQTAFTNDSGIGLINDPDTNSTEANPLFVDVLNNDFHLDAISPAIDAGRNGETLGAYGLGAETIGALWTNEPSLDIIFTNGFE